MRYRALCVIVCLTLFAASHAATSELLPQHSPGAVEILVDGAPQRRYHHAGRWYVQAHKGQEYAIRLSNPYGVRVAVALSVDGLNTIDARQTSAAAARKWVLDPYQTVSISGWQTSRTEARRFEFTTEERSYGQALGKTGNLGVISAVFFKERTRAAQETAAAPEEPPAARAQRDLSAARRLEGKEAESEYAATGMGRSAEHVVVRVRLDLEQTPAHSVNIRYEFRSQLVKLGILPAPSTGDPLARRERAVGFEPGFCPVPSRR
jgi:hypothetical protein